MQKRLPAVSRSSSSHEVHANHVANYIVALENMSKRAATSTTYQVVGYPTADKIYMEDTMGLITGVESVESATTLALNELKYQVKELRASIAFKQEKLRVELAKLAAVKKIARGGK